MKYVYFKILLIFILISSFPSFSIILFLFPVRGVTEKSPEVSYLKMCVYSYMFKLQSPWKYSPFDAIHKSRLFSTAQSHFWTNQFWCLLVLLPFCFTSSTSAKHFPFEDFSHPGKQKQITWSEIRWTGRVGHGGQAVFGQKLLNTWCGVGRCDHKSPTRKWANKLKESSKKIHWSQTQPLTTTPAVALIQMGSQNTNLAGEACIKRGPPSRR